MISGASAILLCIQLWLRVGNKSTFNIWYLRKSFHFTFYVLFSSLASTLFSDTVAAAGIFNSYRAWQAPCGAPTARPLASIRLALRESSFFFFFPYPPDESGTSPAGEGLAHQSLSRHTPGNESGGRKRGEHMFNKRVRLRRFAYRRAIGLLQKTVGIKPESVHGWWEREREVPLQGCLVFIWLRRPWWSVLLSNIYADWFFFFS